MTKPTASSPGTLQATVQGADKPRFGEVRIRNRGRLPHWEREAGLYFVTFRLADSLPRPVLEKIVDRRRMLEAAKCSGFKLLPRQKAILAEYSPRRVEEIIDSGSGACFLSDPSVAELVAEALRFWDGRKFRLVAWCIMPNHVHVILRLFPGQELSGILWGWKSYTARMANRILGRKGSFWQREYMTG